MSVQKNLHLLSALMIAATALGAVLAGWAARQEKHDLLAERLDGRATAILSSLQQQIGRFEYGLRGVRGAVLVAGGDTFNIEQFHNYAAGRDIDAEFPGALGFGVIQRVPLSSADAYMDRVRSSGQPDFQIRQLRQHEGERFVIRFIAPEAPNAAAVGLDIASDEERRVAAIAAMLSGKATLTAPIKLVQASGQADHGFLFLLPIYRVGVELASATERTGALIGWSFAPIIIDDIFKGSGSLDPEIKLSIKDVSDIDAPSPPFFKSSAGQVDDAIALSRERTLELFGRRWSVNLIATPAFVAALNLTSPWLSAAGVALPGGLLVVVFNFYFGWARRQRQASEEAVRLAHARESAVQNERLALATRAGGVGIWEWNILTNELVWDSRMSELYGIDIAATPPTHEIFIAAVDCDHRARIDCELAAAVNENGSFDTEFPIIAHTGERRVLRALANVVCDLDGRAIKMIGTNWDVTESRNADAAVRESELRLRALADALPQKVWLATPDGTASYYNRQMSLYHGPIGLMLADRVAMNHPEDAARMTLVRQAAYERGETFETEGRLKRHDGAWRWHRLVMIPVRRDEQGKVTEWLGTSLDIHDIITANEELERARAAAEAGARAKAEFLANMSHELRTPLTGMLGVHDLLHMDPSLSERQLHYVRLAQESGRSLLIIVNDILDFSKIEAGHLTIEQAPFSLRELVESCRQLGAEMIKHKNVRLFADVAADVPDLLLGDPTRLRQVLLNLTTNAIKFTSHGKVAIHASWTLNDRLRVTVADTGIGIAPNVMPLLFERFAQADGSTARRFGGTGLGLAICKRLMDLMDGQIGVKSELARGSTFWFELSLKRAEAEGEGEQPPTTDDNRLALAATQSWRILLAEDNAINQEVLRAALEMKGHQITMVADGVQAVTAYRTDRFDIVLMDVQMPGKDGLTAAAEIRAFELTQGWDPTPIVALTANAMAEEAKRCRKAGMNAHVAKPIDWAELFVTIDRLCLGHDIEPSGLKILVVEDMKINQRLAGAILESAGHRVDFACDGAEAIIALQNTDYDVVLMDVQMPGVDGVTATRSIRALSHVNNTVPIIAATANNEPAQIAAFKAAGMDEHIGKPFMRIDLLAAIDRVVARAGSVQPAADLAFGQDLFDPSIYARVVDMLGRAEAEALLDILIALVEQGIASIPLDTSNSSHLAAEAHRIVSSSGTLGFMALSRACADLEAACLGSGEIAAPLAFAVDRGKATVRHIATIKAA